VKGIAVNLLKSLLDKAVKSNPVFGLMLGLCPTLAVTTSVKNGLAMGLAASVVLLCSNILISLIKKLIPKEVRIACYIVVIAGFVTMVEILMKALAPAEINKQLGIFIPLIVVNCIILGRAEAFASRNGVVASIGDAVGIGLGYTGVLVMIGTIRELIGKGTFLGYTVWSGYSDAPEALAAPATIAVLAPGAFIVIGLLFGLFNAIGNRKRAAQRAAAQPVRFTTSADEKAKDGSAAAEPSAQ
jgi:electron transport complex protein RnfE